MDITGTDHIAWSKTRSTPYVPTPLLLNGWLYYLRHTRAFYREPTQKPAQNRVTIPTWPDFRVYSSPVAVKGEFTSQTGMEKQSSFPTIKSLCIGSERVK